MATSFSFGNKIIKIPGSYSRIESGIRNTPQALTFGALLVIDTGSMAGWGGGAGVDGEASQNIDSIYTFNNPLDAQNYVKGGIWFDLLSLLFRPSSLGIPGISTVSFIRAATTKGAEIAYTFAGGGTNGGTITFKCLEEGLVGNGVTVNSQLSTGYAGKMIAGEAANTYRIQIWRGTYKGLDYANEPIGGISTSNSKEVLLIESPDFNNITALGTWAQADPNLNTLFTTTFAASGTGVVTATDLAANTAYELAAGGTEVYDAAGLTAALEASKDLVVDFILADRWGADALDTENLQILGNIQEKMVYKPDLYVGAYTLQSEFATSLATAATYDSDMATVVHGGLKVPKRNGSGFKNSPSIYLAAQLLGREAGLPPQVPLTFKGINIFGLTHMMSDREAERALDGGLLVVRKVNGSFDVLKGINSLQNNMNLLNEDSTSPSKQVKRIVRQLNKEITIFSRAQLLKTPFGVNRNTLSPEDLKNWLETYLSSVTATPQQDNLILSFEDVNVIRNQDAYFTTYGVVLNGEISFLFFLGTTISI